MTFAEWLLIIFFGLIGLVVLAPMFCSIIFSAYFRAKLEYQVRFIQRVNKREGT